MQDCNSDIKEYHSDRVKLTAAQKDKLRGWRDSNRDRLRRGLENNEDPSPLKSVAQGSFAMHTTIQEPGNEYDIDDGVVFSQESLQGPHGAEKKALDARNMVRDAVDDGSFKRQPEIKTNCVRVFYNEGPHVDIPVYRSDGNGYELASADWKESDPKGVNAWFAERADLKKDLGLKHFRELIRLLKSMCKNRPFYSLPSGFVITVLVDKCYDNIGDDRLDIDLYNVIESLRKRLAGNLYVLHPVVATELLIDGNNVHKTEKLKEVLDYAAEKLECLKLQSCTHLQALKAWRDVFNTDYFKDKITAEEEKAKTKAREMVVGAAIYNPRQHSENETKSG